MTSKENISSRIYGFWALLLAFCGAAALYGSPEIFILCNIVSLGIWSNGCETRGKNYRPASLEGNWPMVHIALMFCVAGITIGVALELYNFFAGAIIGLSIIPIVLGWDLIIYDTAERYNERKAQQVKQTMLDEPQSNRSFLLRLPGTQTVIAITGILMLIVMVVVGYQDFVSQFSEWWALIF